MKRFRSLNLPDQCKQAGWSLEKLSVERLHDGTWTHDQFRAKEPELLAAAYFVDRGYKVSWCEGGTIKLLMKAAALETLAKHNYFNDRSDAITRYLEAQLTLLGENVNQFITAVASANRATVDSALREILSHGFVQETFPTVKAQFALELFDALGCTHLGAIAEIFSRKPYDYRAGWPDLTLIGGAGVRFVEVKTSDKLHESQRRFAVEVAEPLGLDCSVLQLCAGLMSKDA